MPASGRVTVARSSSMATARIAITMATMPPTVSQVVLSAVAPFAAASASRWAIRSSLKAISRACSASINGRQSVPIFASAVALSAALVDWACLTTAPQAPAMASARPLLPNSKSARFSGIAVAALAKLASKAASASVRFFSAAAFSASVVAEAFQ